MREDPALNDARTLVARIALLCVVFVAVSATACGSDDQPRPLPSPVAFRQEPDGVTLADPAFEALPGARADFGRLGGSVYQIEMPDEWNGRLLLWMHGYLELGPETSATAPDFRRYLIGHGYAWGSSSFSSSSSIPGRSADETAALWDYFVQKYGRPEWTYASGLSMGGAASHIAAERYPDRFDGALAFCGSAGQTPGFEALANFFAAAAYVAGITQEEFDSSTNVGGLIQDQILPALEDPARHEQFEDIMLDLTGGPRAFDREGFHLEEETNWRRAHLAVSARLASNVGAEYRLGPISGVDSDEFNRAIIRLPANDELLRSFTEGEDTTGDLQMPLLSLHTTGDGQVAIEQARILQRRVDAAGKSDLLVQRIFRDAGHCGFNTPEWEASLEALVGWVEHGKRPEGDNVLVDDLSALRGKFELTPRDGTAEADEVPGASNRVTVGGILNLDGAPFDARFLGAVVRRNALVSPCQYTLPTINDGEYEIRVFAESETSGCGAPGAEIFLWTFVNDQKLYSREFVAWPGNGGFATFDASFSTSVPAGTVPLRTEFAGEVYNREGEHVAPGTRVEAYAGDTLCGVGSTRRTGSFIGYIFSVVGPDSIPGCERDATIRFRINGEPALETATNVLEADDGGGGGGFDLTLQ